MIYILIAISLISLVINVLMYRRITATYLLEAVEELELTPSHCCCEVVIEHLESSKQEEAHEHRYPQPNGQGFPVNQCLDCGYWDGPPETKNTEAYQAWTNRQEIPWVPPTTAPEPLIKSPNRGPLARPDGFI
jgi:hypothetical protein